MNTASSGERAQLISALAQEIREQLGESNVLDALSRELARQRLTVDDLTARLRSTEDELAAVKLAQRARDVLLPKVETAYQGRKDAQVDASAPLPPERGFHGLERDGNGMVFRWTGPHREFHYELHLDRSERLMFSLQVPLWGAEHAKGLVCSSDGQTIALRHRTAGRMVVIEGVLPVRSDVGLTRIDFCVDHLQTVAAKTEGGAPRELGVPILRLKVGPVDDATFREWQMAVDPTAEVPAADPASAPKGATKTAAARPTAQASR